jgi:hypothetical protein
MQYKDTSLCVGWTAAGACLGAVLNGYERYAVEKTLSV